MYKKDRNYSTQCSNIHPEWITGISDRSASFSIIVHKRKEGNWEIRPVFEIFVNSKYKEVLNYINTYFKVGSIYILKKNNSIIYRINKLKDLNDVVIPHFRKYLLLSKKRIIFDMWVECIEIINKKEHKDEKGFYKLLSLYANIGRGLSKKVAKDFPNLIPVSKPVYIKPNKDLSEYWMSGYFCIYCNFNVDANPHGFGQSLYNRIVPSFNFSRNIEELPLMECIANYFNASPKIRSNGSRVDVNIYGLDKAKLVLNLFNTFPLFSIKYKEFIKWSEIVNKLISISNIPKTNKLSLDFYIPTLYKLINELNDIRNSNKT